MRLTSMVVGDPVGSSPERTSTAPAVKPERSMKERADAARR